MKYFIDTEFIEGKQDKTILGFKYGETKPTIDLISVGIVSEEIKEFNGITNTEINENTVCKLNKFEFYNTEFKNREYYAISKDFNLKQAWKNEWVRENVLRPIFNELENKDYKEYNKALQFGIVKGVIGTTFNINNLRKYINRYGKTNKQVAKEIIQFCRPKSERCKLTDIEVIESIDFSEFYAYYADYDWVVFCQLFGTMIDLPKGFPMYCIDLKQELDKKAIEVDLSIIRRERRPKTLSERLEYIKSKRSYPTQTNEHNALADAKWNYELYKFLNIL